MSWTVETCKPSIAYQIRAHTMDTLKFHQSVKRYEADKGIKTATVILRSDRNGGTSKSHLW
jgi:hypothetical protein